jgi:hypothetical protein
MLVLVLVLVLVGVILSASISAHKWAALAKSTR